MHSAQLYTRQCNSMDVFFFRQPWRIGSSKWTLTWVVQVWSLLWKHVSNGWSRGSCWIILVLDKCHITESHQSNWTTYNSGAPYGLRGIIRSWFICWFQRYMYCLLVYLASSTYFLFSLLTYLFPYIPFPLRIDTLLFQAGGCKRRPNLCF